MKKRVISIGKIKIGADQKIAVQSMVKKNPHDKRAILKEIKELEEVGCDIIRLAIPDKKAVEIFKDLKKKTSTVLVADIHFDFRLALDSIDAGADKIRINPSNLGGEDALKKVLKKAKKANIPIRVGVNAGSVKDKKISPQKLVDLCLENVNILLKENFENIVVSIKSSKIEETIKSNEALSKKSPFPIHLGLTEAGPLISGTIKSTSALLPLLKKGIGDTIRVSLTSSAKTEVKVAKDILNVVNKEKNSIEIISCPTCGRTKNNLEKIALELEERLAVFKKPLKVAIMGCEVNGQGEIREADLGIIGGRKISLFSKGKFIKFIREDEVVGEIEKMISNDTDTL